MKIAKLPNGKVLRFPSEVSDEIVDAVAKEAMKDYMQMSAHEKKKNEESEAVHNKRHSELLNGLHGLINSHATILNHAIQGHKEIIGALNALTKAQSKPKKRRAIRDEKGQLIGAEDYE